MKIIFISDIHGIKTNLKKIENIIEESDKLVVLGDLYYIGPRNKLNSDYDILYVQEFLTKYKNKLICMRGNCDSNVDISVSDFLINEGISYLSVDEIDVYITHGDYYNINNHYNMNENSILIYGHEHMPYIKKQDNRYFINTGSISLPRNSEASYLTYEDNKFTLYDINNNIIDILNYKN